ncbi:MULTISPECIES: hypothetical protein [Clostridium]|uniref:Uncharacterized protein n=1 Tax=Clostridium frigoriphilum TaxID=443253 RepID=A0ABU7UWJ3_9CLOT|nr:hypothetical protein [Clostridium sp. DSM 17811]MBU3102138.1 hypothetical protein [Clostridium sp. DSM 17811]
MKKTISIVLMFIMMLTIPLSVSAKPTFGTLVKEYENASRYMLFTACIKDNIGQTGNIKSIAGGAYQEYVRLANPDLPRYTLQTFMDRFELISRTGYEVSKSAFKTTARISATAVWVQASYNLSKAKKRLRSNYPASAKAYFGEITGGTSSGGGSSGSY